MINLPNDLFTPKGWKCPVYSAPSTTDSIGVDYGQYPLQTTDGIIVDYSTHNVNIKKDNE